MISCTIMRLTPKQSRFVDEYMVDFNATRAAIRAGYSAKTAQPASSRLLSKVMISEEVGRRKEELAKQVPPERIVRELARIGFANISDYMRQVGDNDLVPDLRSCTREQMAAVQEIIVEEYTEGKGENARPVKRVRFKLHDKRAALVDLGRHVGLFPKDGNTLNVNLSLEALVLGAIKLREAEAEGTVIEHAPVEEDLLKLPPKS
jgi:phage terminase small subunit